ncbi:Transient receptor putative cation channel subfamily V member 6 [Exophiala xenobiotica]|uniref:Transient receptor putative cation channel subfamily V member 6 n=1 Tax=Lithohypha guttulata TaxID=1690604 RepID=A0ABR0JTD4_9EURO|nr:Transient receptor putative cation channel subfamily V member 6 [Lithohypha guttulata]KAK5308940.1 Transient receptor putative cation channel subfamily V member 6 [Exophiala xenobiotica]
MQIIRKLMKPEKSNKFLTWLHDYIWTEPCLGSSNFILEDNWMQFTESVTPLHCAAFLRIPNLIEWLVSEGVATNGMSVVGSPLHCAILGTDVFTSAIDEATDYGFIECVGAPEDTTYAAIRALIRCQADVNQVYWRRKGKTYVSALYLLLRGWASDIKALCRCINLLLNAGATLDGRAVAVAKFNERDVSVVECFGADHVEKTYRAEFLDILRSCKDSACAENQMAEFSVVDDTSKQQNVDLLQSTLRFAARFQQLPSLEKLLAIDKVDVNAADDVEGLNALHIAAKYGNIDAASILLSHGADVNAISSFGNTPLHECAWRRDTTMVSLLLSKDAITDIQNKIHNTAWSTAAIHDNIAMLEMFEATYEGQEDTICELLALKHGPLFRAAESGRAEEATVFLASNTRRANLVDEDGYNLSHRVRYMSFGLLKTLTQQGLDVRAIDKLGRTALHVIAESELPQTFSNENVRLLLAQGCDPDHISHPHGTALHALLANKSFMNETDVIKNVDYVQLFFSESVKTAVDGGGMTVLDACTTKAWHTPGFIEVFNCLLLYGMQSGTDRDLFADLVNQLLGVPDPAWTSEHLFLPRASNILRKLLTIHPDPSVIVHGLKGRRAAVWAARHSLSDLLLDLVNKGVSLTYKVEELESECVLQAMMRGHHEDAVLRSVLDLSSDHDLETKSKISGSMLHLLCAKDSSARAVVVPMLLDRGLDVDAACDNGRTPLMMAASSGRLEHLRCLLARGASV